MNKNEFTLFKLNIPPIIFGTSGLGNLFEIIDESKKLATIEQCILHSKGNVVFDTAGKYGAGLALEVLGRSLKKLNVDPKDVIISNKLGWVRTPLLTEEPTFEPGIWKGLSYDAVQKISYDGILECFEQGNELLNGYIPQMVSVHDPDEYLDKAKDEAHEHQLYEDILSAYKALYDLKLKGKVKGIGVGAKDWRSIQKIAKDVPLDWVMVANSLTIKQHPPELLDFMEELKNKGTFIIDSAIFHSGFLVGGDYFNYKLVVPGVDDGDTLLQWRSYFFDLCQKYSIKPAAACVQFALHIPGINSIALSTTEPSRVENNIGLARVVIPSGFWKEMKQKGMIEIDFSN